MLKSRDLTVGNILPSAAGGIAAGLVLSYFGVAGSLVGAAIGPVVFLIVKELTRGPTEAAVARAARTPGRLDPASRSAGGQGLTTPVHVYGRRSRRRAAWLVATAAIASVIAIGVVTIPELIAGSSLTGSGRTTFFHPGSGGSGSGGGATTTTTEQEPAPSVTTAPDEEPATTETTEEAPDAVPQTTAPESSVSEPVAPPPESAPEPTPAPEPTIE